MINICYFFTVITFSPLLAVAIDTITAAQPLTYGRTIVSAGDVFELGFFNPGNSNWYVGIWYRQIPEITYVWVANRNNPLRNSSGATLRIGEYGELILSDNSSNTIWSSNRSAAANPVAQLLDSGNLVVREESDSDPENYLWQSFDHPTDTLLPGMRLGWDSRTGLNRFLTSWRSRTDPSSGNCSFRLDINGFPEIFLLSRDERVYRSGPWNGLRFSGVPEMNSSSSFTFSFSMTRDEVFYSFEVHTNSLYSRLTVTSSGRLQRFTYFEPRSQWINYWYAPADQCDQYLQCGPYGVCDINSSPVCSCVGSGFSPRYPQAWNLRDGSGGCARTSQLNCRTDGFVLLRNMKLPETSRSFLDVTMGIDDCRRMCLGNCSCTAYASSNISNGGSGCVIWTTELLDMRHYAMADGGQDLYVRVAASDLESQNGSNRTNSTLRIVGIVVGIAILLIVLSGLCFLLKRRRKRKIQSVIISRRETRGPIERSEDLLLKEAVIPSRREYSGESSTGDELELPLFDFSTIVLATENFSDKNKLGQGGFGSVYKGILVEGQEIAVKRLSKNSGQGIEEFKNEVRLIARLQHRNLVRLLGCCIETEEKMLLYEYMENKSLDSILFNKEKSLLLDWKTRYNIICGIARGLLYLHQDSRFRIIHRDLKASNVLLDKEMNPKISDFGMARIFGGDQTEANTKRVVGTYGYMSPEYAMDGLFSVKSDVFSFGVLVLEIVSGTKNKGFYNNNNQLNLLAHAWKMWREGRGEELVDSSTRASYSPSEAMRCIQVGLLCVQEQAEDRPNMATVLLMLSSETATMPQPKHPGFAMGRRQNHIDKEDESCTVNEVTVTMLDGR